METIWYSLVVGVLCMVGNKYLYMSPSPVDVFVLLLSTYLSTLYLYEHCTYI